MPNPNFKNLLPLPFYNLLESCQRSRPFPLSLKNHISMEKDNSGAKPKQAYPKIPSSLSLQAHFSEKKGEVLVTPKKNGSRLSMYAAPVSFASPQAKVSHGFSATTFYGRGMSHGITPSPSESSDCKVRSLSALDLVSSGSLLPYAR